MKYKITIYVLVVISLISLLSHYLIYEKFTKYLLHDAGDLSRINYDLSYRSQIRNKIIDKNKYFFFKEGEKNNSFVTTMGDSFLNCKNEKTCIQNYFSIEHYPVTHFSLRPDKYSFPQVLDSTLDYLNSEYFILESVERGLVPTYGSRLFSLNDIQSESIQQDNNKGEKTKIEFFKFLNTANFKFIFRKLLDLSSFRSDNFFVNQVQSMFFGKAVKKKLNRDFFSVNPNQLYFSNDDYKSKFVSDSQMSTIVQNFVYLNKKLERAGQVLILVIVPNKLTVYGPSLKEPIYIDFYNKLITELEKNKIHFVNLKDKYSKLIYRENDLYQSDDTHLSRKGSIITGRLISDYISSLTDQAP
jgi:hypothetical protein